jgi:hypothetical protein
LIAAMSSTRKTYVVSVHEHDGPATVEEVRTGRKARLSSLREIATQIERWLREPRPAAAERAEGGR